MKLKYKQCIFWYFFWMVIIKFNIWYGTNFQIQIDLNSRKKREFVSNMQRKSVQKFIK